MAIAPASIISSLLLSRGPDAAGGARGSTLRSLLDGLLRLGDAAILLGLPSCLALRVLGTPCAARRSGRTLWKATARIALLVCLLPTAGAQAPPPPPPGAPGPPPLFL